MKIYELIKVLSTLDQDSEIGIILSDEKHKIFEIISINEDEIVAGEFNQYYFEKELDFTKVIK